jgi:CRP-like cAMP-binding protein
MPVDMDLFRAVKDKTRDALLETGRRMSFARDETLFHQGDASTDLILILEGMVKIWRVAPDGSSITLTVVGAGEPIGTLHAVEEMPHTATATALVPTRVIDWPIEQMRALMQSDAALTSNVLAVVARYATLMIKRLEEVSTVSVEGRVARALCRAASAANVLNVDADIRLSRQDIADMSSSTLPTVSRIMSRWRERGLIAGHRGRVRILDAKTLCAIAGWPDEGAERPG